MTGRRLLLRNLIHHWRGNLALLLGVAVGTTVLTGALLIGDSQRGSLADLAVKRLGWVDAAVVSGQLVRRDLASGLDADHVAPVILARGAVEVDEPGTNRRTRAAILGVDASFWPDGKKPGTDFWKDGDDVPILIDSAVANDLKVGKGDKLRLSLQRSSSVPREALLGQRDSSTVQATFTAVVDQILTDEPMVGFTLEPGHEAPRNVFVPLARLQDIIIPRPVEGDPDPPSRDRVNVVLIKGGTADSLSEKLAASLTLDDADVRLRRNASPSYLSVESRRTILPPAVVDAALEAAKALDLPAAPTLVHLANKIDGKGGSIPYSVVAALDPQLPMPLGPFLASGEKPLADDEILLVDWPESPLKVKIGDPIAIAYHPAERSETRKEKEAVFRLRGFVPLDGPAGDRGLTPSFPGITDKDSPRDWVTPSAFDREDIQKKMKPRDNDWWRKRRATPKAYITMRRGEQLWGSRFGDRTSIRIALPKGDESVAAFRREFLKRLSPERLGLSLQTVRADAMKAAGGGTDFAMLFLSFSFFLIVSSLMLVGLLFRLGLDQRAREFGVFAAMGLRLRFVRRLLLLEGGIVALLGAVVGTGCALIYGEVLLGRLRDWWPGGLDASTLSLHVSPTSLGIGLVSAFLVSLATIFLVARSLARMSPRALLQGRTSEDVGDDAPSSRRAVKTAVVALVGALVCLIAGNFVQAHEARAGTFFGSGMLLLVAGIAALSMWMRDGKRRPMTGAGTSAVARLGVRNASRHAVRSILTAGLLAAATFLLVGVESFHREPGKDFHKKDGGSGGYSLLAESDLPLFVDLNTEAGRTEVLEMLETRLNKRQPAPSAAELEEAKKRAEALLKSIEVVAFRVQRGEDASCLNLHQPRTPTLLGVPEVIIKRGGFSFSGFASKQASDWSWLNLQVENHPEVAPVFGEQNTVVWMLKSGLGRDILVKDSQGRERKLAVVGLLHDSVFQNGLLMSEKRFLSLHPESQGHRFFLIDAEPERADEVKELLETALWDRGFSVTPTKKRLESYLQVENMYIAAFQKLGAMGLILGTLGLAVVLLRGVWERRGELALLRAMGWRRGTLAWLVVAENGFLLLVGMGMGTMAAVVSVMPHALTGGGDIAWGGLLGMLGLSLAVGLVACVAATAATVRAELLPALRRD